MDKYYINDEKWQTIYDFLRGLSGIRISCEKKTRCFVEAIYNILKTGSQWRELPPYYGKWRSVHKRYESWCKKGIWSQLLGLVCGKVQGTTLRIN